MTFNWELRKARNRLYWRPSVLIALAGVLIPGAALAQCAGGLVFLGPTADGTRSVWLSGTRSAGSYQLDVPGQTVDMWTKDRRGLRVTVSPVVANGNPGAQKARNFLNGTWLGEPLHVVLTDVPIGAWTVAMVFDALEMINSRHEFALAADTSIAIGLAGAAGAAIAGVTDWSDVDPPARRLGLIHGLLNIGATALFATSLILRKRKARSEGRGFAAGSCRHGAFL